MWLGLLIGLYLGIGIGIALVYYEDEYEKDGDYPFIFIFIMLMLIGVPMWVFYRHINWRRKRAWKKMKNEKML